MYMATRIYRSQCPLCGRVGAFWKTAGSAAVCRHDQAVQSDLERIDTRASARTVLVIATISAKINNFLTSAGEGDAPSKRHFLFRIALHAHHIGRANGREPGPAAKSSQRSSGER
jgi:hypothetical protein